MNEIALFPGSFSESFDGEVPRHAHQPCFRSYNAGLFKAVAKKSSKSFLSNLFSMSRISRQCHGIAINTIELIPVKVSELVAVHNRHSDDENSRALLTLAVPLNKLL